MTRVLVVDDEFDIAEVVRLVLEEQGYDVVSATDGAEAKSLLADESADPPNLIVTDMMMPHVSGADLVRWVRSQERLRDVPIIVMSAVRPTTSDLDGGWQEFVQKPFTLHRLVASVQAALNQGH